MFHPKGPTFFELAQQALSSTRHGYDLLAPKFDYTPFRTPDFLLEPVAQLIAESGPFATGLDICCGTGAGMKILRPTCSESIVGIDFSEPMLRVAERELKDVPGTARIGLVQGDALQMPFENAFDVAVCFGALGHILPSQQENFIGEIKRTLRPGGRFVFATSSMPSRFTARYWLARSFNAAMHVRNRLLNPPFVMFYLTFLLEEAIAGLQDAGFQVEVRQDIFPAPFNALAVVTAIKT